MLHPAAHYYITNQNQLKMKKRIIMMSAGLLLCSFLFTSCYTYKTQVGEGAKGTQQVKKWNHYMLGGLVRVKLSDPQKMAGDAKDYTVKTKQTFVNGLVTYVTFYIYSPTTTYVTK